MAAEAMSSAISLLSAVDAEQFLQRMSDAYFLVDSCRVIQHANPAAYNLFSGQPLVGRCLDEFIHRDLDHKPPAMGDVLVCHSADDGGDEASALLQLTHFWSAGNHSYHCLLTPLATGCQDLARHDLLTGQLNRQAFEMILGNAVQDAYDQQSCFGLLYLDLYQFKLINDSYGHAGGDRVLRRVAALIDGCLRGQDVLARLGSDEFGLLLPGISLAGARRLSDSLIETFQNTQFHWRNTDFQVSACIGVAQIDARTESAAEALARASGACESAQAIGRNRIVLADSDVDAARRMTDVHWVKRLNDALRNDHFCLYQQKLQAVRPGLCDHHEVLLRLRDYSLSEETTETPALILPEAFIPAAERYGLMDDIDRWVVTRVLDYLQQRQRQGLPLPVLSVNLSGATLGDGAFTEFVVDRIEQAGIEAAYLHFEITETAAIRHLDSAIGFMRTLRARGSCFFLDDFGSGLSSFGYLKELPVDFLKIDGSFVRGMLEDRQQRAMVSSFVQLAQSLDLKTVAEYVESADLRQALVELGVDYVQGDGIARAMPLT